MPFQERGYFDFGKARMLTSSSSGELGDEKKYAQIIITHRFWLKVVFGVWCISWNQFCHITWPMLAPTTFFIFVTSIIAGFQSGFDAAYILTQGGPAGATTTLDYYIYNHAFVYFNMGYASTIAVVLFFIVFCVTMINWRFGGRKVHYG